MHPLLHEVQTYNHSAVTAFRPIGSFAIDAMVAHMLVNWAMEISDSLSVAPLQYVLLLWAVLFGSMFFGDVPRLTKLIVASGLFIFIREQMLKKRDSVLPAVPE